MARFVKFKDKDEYINIDLIHSFRREKDNDGYCYFIKVKIKSDFYRSYKIEEDQYNKLLKE